MTDLVAFLSTGKGTWGHVARVIDGEKWDKVILITNEYGKENFTAKENTELLAVDTNVGLTELRDEIFNSLVDTPRYCSVPVYGPVGRAGTAEIYIEEGN